MGRRVVALKREKEETREMMKIFVLLLVVGCATVASAFSTAEDAHDGLKLPGTGGADMSIDGFKAPWFCHGIDCPVFKVLNANNETTASLWEEREYPSQEWTETYVSGMDLDKAESAGFMRLFNYIQGANAAKNKIDMTAPVLNYITPGEAPSARTTTTFRFTYHTRSRAKRQSRPRRTC